MYSPPTCIFFFAIYMGANHEVDLLLRYQFTAAIKAYLVSYLFPVSLFSVLETNKSCRGQGQILPLEGVDKSKFDLLA